MESRRRISIMDQDPISVKAQVVDNVQPMTQSALRLSKRLACHRGLGPATGARDNIEDPKANSHVSNDVTPHDRVATDGIPVLKDHVESMCKDLMYIQGAPLDTEIKETVLDIGPLKAPVGFGWSLSSQIGERYFRRTFEGRVTLVKSILSALPTYVKQTTLLPKAVCHDLERAVRNFLWGISNEKWAWNTISWEKNMQAKIAGWSGGIASTWSHVIRGMQWIVENGHTIKFWQHVWLPIGTKMEDLACAPIPQDIIDLTVADFVHNGAWNVELFIRYLHRHVVNDIHMHPVASADLGENHLSWSLTSGGIFSMKIAYTLFSDRVVDRRE
ncbi:hypothetical protein SESBI_40590 [Sesbania bispinosa]|nr:hypothetical protein SESBI_40590 [Sesbania bispinosa]